MCARVTAVGLMLLLAVAEGLSQETTPAGGISPPPVPAGAAGTAVPPANGGDMFQAVALAIEELKSANSENFAKLSLRLDQMEKKLVTRDQLDAALQAEADNAAARFAAKTDLQGYVPRSEFAALESKFNSLQDAFDDQAAQIRTLRGELSAQITAVDDQAQQIRQVVNAISRTDSQQRPILDLNSSMASQEFQRDLSGAVHSSLRREGRLLVTNQMSTTQYLRVNGTLHAIPAFTSNYAIAVPTGTLTTELAGEAPKNWSITAPTYEQGIVIAPRQASVVVASPIVYWSF